jgi:hypothetical protein
MSFLAALPAIAEAVGVGAAETAAVGGAAAAGGAEAAAVGATEAGAAGAGRAGLMGRTANFRRGMMAEKAVDGSDSKDDSVAPSEQYDINKVTKG